MRIRVRTIVRPRDISVKVLNSYLQADPRGRPQTEPEKVPSKSMAAP